MKKEKAADKRKLVQVTMQIYEDQAEKLEEQSKDRSKQSIVREALDASGICDETKLIKL